MYGLYAWLLVKGQAVYLNARIDIPSIGIYPEIYHGNDMGCENVVRYILQKPGMMATGGIPGPVSFPKDDLIYSFSKMYYRVDDDHTLYLPILNLHLFFDQKRKRTKKAVFKGDGVDKNKHPKDCIPITKEMCLDQRALANFLNECEVMYAYEPVSAMYEIARLCGVRIVLIQDFWTKEEWNKNEAGLNGINWGKDEGILLDTEAFRKHYTGLRDTFEKRLDRFIAETQND